MSNYTYNATVTNVVDGDTFDAVVDLGFTVSVNVRFRLYGIDTPELRDSDPEKKKAANDAKRYVVERIKNKTVTLKTHKTDVYGRWLAEVFVDGQSLSKELIEKGLGIERFW